MRCLRRTIFRVEALTKQLWTQQDQHEGDRWRLFSAVADVVPAERVLYPGSFVDIAPSFVFSSVTYVDVDRRADRFFADHAGVREIVAAHAGAPTDPRIEFVRADFTTTLNLPEGGFDLLVSLYAGFVSEHCTRHLRIGGTLLVNPSHGDAAMASIDPRYRLTGVVTSRQGRYRIGRTGLTEHLQPKAPVTITKSYLHERRRGVSYTKPAFAYLFDRVA